MKVKAAEAADGASLPGYTFTQEGRILSLAVRVISYPRTAKLECAFLGKGIARQGGSISALGHLPSRWAHLAPKVLPAATGHIG